MTEKHMLFSMKALLYCGERFLILQKKDKEGKLPWELPGGGVNFGEEPRQALRREIMEETGLGMEFVCSLTTWRYQKGEQAYLTGVICLCMTDKEQVRLSHEHVDYRWIYPEELHAYALHPSLLESIKTIKPQNLLRGYEHMLKFCEGIDKRL